MRRWLQLIGASILLFSARSAGADLCDKVKDADTTAETRRDVDFYEQLFTDATYRGHRKWNEIVLECNRKRDTKGNQIGKATAASGDNAEKRQLRSRDLEARIIRGHYNFFGTIVTQLKYVYVLSKKGGVWTMVLPYQAEVNDLVPDRVDFDVGSRSIDPRTGDLGAVRQTGHAWRLYDASQVVSREGPGGRKLVTLVPGAAPIATTLCSRSIFFAGKQDKYDGKNGANAYKRDPENKFISLGKLQYGYKNHAYLREGCRVHQDRDLYWQSPDGRVVKVKPRDWIFDNFVRVAEEYWSIPGVFELKVLLKGRNEPSIPARARDLLQLDDHLTVRFATRFMPYQYNQMYKSNIIQFNNFSTMTSDETIQHEVGHAFGLDDEYGGEKKDGEAKQNSCKHTRFAKFDPLSYQMCGDDVGEDRRSIYHYLAVSRYITVQNECGGNGDCKSGEYCDRGTITIGKNQCVALKEDHQTCALVDGGHQCKSGHCRFSRCYTPGSVPMGDTCYVDDACRQGKCSAIDGTRGTCVCNADSDCGQGYWCDQGIDFKRNACRAKLGKGEKCGKAGSLGNDHKCKSGECSGFPRYECK
jgi:hypothetical protein